MIRFAEKSGLRYLFQRDYRKILLDSVTGLPSKLPEEAIGLFAIVANERHFLSAWLDHHRQLGVTNFYIFVDESNDGTEELLQNEQDVTVLRSSLSYGFRINVHPCSFFGFRKFDRAGILYKRVLTDYLFKGRWGLYLDPDEFLILPPEFTIQRVIKTLDGVSESVPATVVEFFPADPATLQNPPASFETFKDVLNAYPYFEDTQILETRPGRFPARIAESKLSTLVELHLHEKCDSARQKTPLMRHSPHNFRMGSHRSSWPPQTSHLLTIAHFSFNHWGSKKIERAMTGTSGHSSEGAKYKIYARLLEQLSETGQNFLSSSSVKYEGAHQLIEYRLMNPL
jgi:hypothetical protein